MLQSTAIRALPSVGVLLGAAFDRAVMATARSWLVVAILIGIQALVVLGAGAAPPNLGNLLLFVWAFFAMANAIRLVFDPLYRMVNKTASDMLGAQMVTGLAVLALNVMLLAAAFRMTLGVLAWLVAAPGAVISLWLYVRWSCGPALAAQGTSSIAALAESWRLTSAAFWQTFAIAVAILVGGTALGFMVGFASSFIRGQAAPLVYGVAILAGQIYITQAGAVAICMWLKALQPREAVAAAA